VPSGPVWKVPLDRSRSTSGLPNGSATFTTLPTGMSSAPESAAPESAVPPSDSDGLQPEVRAAVRRIHVDQAVRGHHEVVPQLGFQGRVQVFLI